MDCSPPGSSVHEILQARILEWVAIFLLQGIFWTQDRTLVSCVSCVGRWILYFWRQLGSSWRWGECKKKNYLLFSFQLVKWKSLSCIRLFATPWTIYIVHGILQARMQEWVAFPFSRGSSQPRDQTQVSHIAGGFFTSWAAWERSRLPFRVDRIVKVKTGVDSETG